MTLPKKAMGYKNQTKITLIQPKTVRKLSFQQSNQGVSVVGINTVSTPWIMPFAVLIS